MSTLFDSSVYGLRNNATSYAQPKPIAFMMEKARFEEKPVILKAEPRGSVASRLWWTLEWWERGQRFEVSSQEWDLLFWRAIQVHKQNERRFELEDGPVSKGPGIFPAELRGWKDGDGI